MSSVTKHTCSVCGQILREGRVPPFCSKTCQASVEGYSRRHIEKLEKLKVEVDGTTAWRPLPLDPIHHIISTKPVLILSDIHAPIHSKEWLTHAIMCGKIWDSDYCILNGDVMDLNQISRHMGSYYRRKAELDDDFSACEAIMKILSKEFKYVVWLSGNHCIERLIKLFRGEVAAQRLLKVIGDYENLKITSRSFIDINDDVRICHPRQYSRIRGSLAQRLAQRWQKSVATGHQHHSSMTYSLDGRWQAVDIPCLAHVELQDYVRNELNDFPEPILGFAGVFKNKIQVFDRSTVWEQWKLPNFELT